MSFEKVTPGKNAPETFNVVIEIAANSDPVKYEVDKETGCVFVDRFMGTAMHYPCNYGYVPQTLAGDGDPVLMGLIRANHLRDTAAREGLAGQVRCPARGAR